MQFAARFSGSCRRDLLRSVLLTRLHGAWLSFAGGCFSTHGPRERVVPPTLHVLVTRADLAGAAGHTARLPRTATVRARCGKPTRNGRRCHAGVHARLIYAPLREPACQPTASSSRPWDSARPGPVRLLLTFPGTASATRIPGRDPRWEGRGGRSRWSGGVQMSRAHLAAAFYGMAGASLTEGAAESGISPVSTPRPPAYDAERLK
jgi:hypothetical protein